MSAEKLNPVNSGPLGLLGFGMTTILLNLHNAESIPPSIVIAGSHPGGRRSDPRRNPGILPRQHLDRPLFPLVISPVSTPFTWPPATWASSAAPAPSAGL